MACIFYVYGWCDFLVLEIRIQTCHSNRQKIVSESGNKQRGFLLKCLFSSRYNFRFLINVSFLEKDLIKGTFQTTNIHKYIQHIACIDPIIHYRKHCLYTKGAHQHKTQLTLKKYMPNHKGRTGDIVVVVKLNKSSARELVGRTQECSSFTLRRSSHICCK